MLTESSKPTIAKKASAVAEVTARNTLLSSGVDQGQHHVGLDAFGRAAQVHQHHQQHEAQRAERDPGLVRLDAEGGEKIGGKRLRRGGRGRQP
ncbi:hypothetical protein G6F24_018260 [Rhizopus arrhizus]|nr:hypothetical protein G6F24_018260 [Rhizopus arrhizus]